MEQSGERDGKESSRRLKGGGGGGGHRGGIEETISKVQKVAEHTLHFPPLEFPLSSTCPRPLVRDSPKPGC